MLRFDISKQNFEEKSAPWKSKGKGVSSNNLHKRSGGDSMNLRRSGSQAQAPHMAGLTQLNPPR